MYVLKPDYPRFKSVLLKIHHKVPGFGTSYRKRRGHGVWIGVSGKRSKVKNILNIFTN